MRNDAGARLLDKLDECRRANEMTADELMRLLGYAGESYWHKLRAGERRVNVQFAQRVRDRFPAAAADATVWLLQQVTAPATDRERSA